MIKLRELIFLKEQQAPTGPVPPPAPPGAPPASPGAAAPSQAPTDAVPTDEPPAEGGAGEYDFTKDFRAYQDTVNKADNTAKKAFIKKANEQLVGKTVTANASRGYGQPKSDYTIKGVKKVSVDWYYKEDVVVLADENDKKYFLTPGVNVKIEAGAEQPEQPAAEEPATDQTPQGAEAPPAAPAAPPTAPPQGAGAPPAPGAAPAMLGAPPAAPGAEAPPAVPGQPPAQGQEEPEDLKKKKKLATAPQMEQIQRDIGHIFSELVKAKHLNKNGVFEVAPYVTSRITENVGDNRVSKFYLEMPKSLFEEAIDVRDLKLSIISEMRKPGGRGQQFCEGSVDVVSVGRNYLFNFEKTTGWKE